ncbi:cytochrome P450 [Actinomycetota bacterium]
MTRARAVASAEAKSGLRWALGHGIPRIAVRAAARRGDLQGRLIASSATHDDATMLRIIDEIREQGPVYRSGLAWITATHAGVHETLSSNDFRVGVRAEGGPGTLGRTLDWAESDVTHPLLPPSLLATEPPDHTRYRKLVTRVFTVRAVEGLRPRVEQLAGELLDRIETGSPVDLVAAYCSQLPVTVIAEILGVPEAERERVLELGAGAAPSLDMGLSWRGFRAVNESLAAFDAWLEGHIAWTRENPGDNLLSQLVRASDEEGTLNHEELKSTAGLVLAAGFETTVNLLGNGIALLVRHPDQLAALRRGDADWANAVDEVLRYDPPVLLTGRMSVRDTEIGGVAVPGNALVTTVLMGANRDPAVFDDPHRFDVQRANAKDHLAFSAGRHYCLGAALARMEGEVGLRAFFDRFGEVGLLPGAQRRHTRILRGYERLPARVG